ncbi:putative toxin-antitoxin system toxin component, PIN family [Candidatus Pacearchaeota archaeon]|nr:putative toxin-antitoxin system toxin component, PIN family [Candidatus Pacearchaeota archaeon]
MRITLDTNFLISATQWDYSVANKLLVKLIERNDPLFVSKEIIDEFSGILMRDFDYSYLEIQEIIPFVMMFAKLVQPIEKIEVIKEDSDDNKILECAVVSNSEFIITYDLRHLLILKEFRGIKIIKPEELFGIINS